MSDALSLAEIDGQHVELLPARTVLSLYGTGWSFPSIDDSNINVNENTNTATAVATDDIESDGENGETDGGAGEALAALLG